MYFYFFLIFGRNYAVTGNKSRGDKWRRRGERCLARFRMAQDEECPDFSFNYCKFYKGWCANYGGLKDNGSEARNEDAKSYTETESTKTRNAAKINKKKSKLGSVFVVVVVVFREKWALISFDELGKYGFARMLETIRRTSNSFGSEPRYVRSD